MRKCSILIVAFLLVWGFGLLSPTTTFALNPDTDLSNADASFWGENDYAWSGESTSGAGDINGDGYD